MSQVHATLPADWEPVHRTVIPGRAAKLYTLAGSGLSATSEHYLSTAFGGRVYEHQRLATMNPDGSDVKRVTNRVGYDGGAFFSPDGSKIVWRAMYPETAADTADYLRLLGQRLVRPSRLELWVANADESDARRPQEA